VGRANARGRREQSRRRENGEIGACRPRRANQSCVRRMVTLVERDSGAQPRYTRMGVSRRGSMSVRSSRWRSTSSLLSATKRSTASCFLERSEESAAGGEGGVGAAGLAAAAEGFEADDAGVGGVQPSQTTHDV